MLQGRSALAVVLVLAQCGAASNASAPAQSAGSDFAAGGMLPPIFAVSTQMCGTGNSTRTNFCPDLPTAARMPFYLQALQSLVVVTVNNFAFPTQLAKAPSVFSLMMMVVSLASFASRVAQDAMTGWHHFVAAWLVAVLTPTVYTFSARWLEARVELKPTSGPGVVAGIVHAVCGMVCACVRQLVIWGLPAVFCFYLVVTASATFKSIFGQDLSYACETIRWSRAIDQLPTMLDTLLAAKAGDEKRLHKHREYFLLPFLALIGIYAPPIAWNLATNVAPAVVVFLPLMLPLPLFLVAVVYLAQRVDQQPSYQEVEVGTRQLDMEAGEEPVDPATTLEATFPTYTHRLLLVPFIIYLQFVGEVAARYHSGEDYLPAIHSTWAARTAQQYVCELCASKVAMVLSIVGWF